MIVPSNLLVRKNAGGEEPAPTPFWHETNWDLTSSGINDAGGVWETPTTLAFNSYSGNANTILFEYKDTGVPESVGKALSLTIEFQDTSGEVVYRLFNVDDGTASPDSYFYPDSSGDPITVVSQPMSNSDIKGVALFNNFGASLPFKIVDAALVDVE